MTGPLTVAVIGHVNHGKTALVRALTGIETDRLKEEIQRGLSIALGFAWRAYGDGAIDFIDTPGHEDFLRNMIAGAAGARAVLLVVSATEGFGRQTWEHLQVARLLGIQTGIVAVTKSDLLAPGAEAAVRAEIAPRLADTLLAGAPIVFCSSTSGLGLEAVHQRLDDLHRREPPIDGPAAAFLPIDRAFTAAGAGVVVTGTLRGGPLRAGGEAILYPSGRRVGLRRLQVHGLDVEAVQPDGRVAVGLRGVSAGEAQVGDVLCAPDAFAPTLQVDALITAPPDGLRPLKHMDELRVLWGARRDVATVRLIGAKAIPPGERAIAQLRFTTPVIAFAGQRAVLRRLSPAETVGGAVVVDPVATPLRGKVAGRLEVLEAALTGDPSRIADALAQRSGGVAPIADTARLARKSESRFRRQLAHAFEALDADRLAPRAAVAEARAAYLDELRAAHSRTPARAAVAAGALRSAIARRVSRDLIGHVERGLAADGAIRLVGALAALPSHDPLAALPPEALARLRAIEVSLRAGGTTPPNPAQLAGPEGEDRPLLRLLIDTGAAICLRNVSLRQTLIFHRDALSEALETLQAAFPPGSPFTTGEARAALGSTRKFIVPLLEHFDTLGHTLRQGDVRRIP